MHTSILKLVVTAVFILSLVSCAQSAPSVTDTVEPSQRPSPAPQNVSPSPAATPALPVQTPSPAPDLSFAEHDGMVTMTDRVTGFCITFPIEYRHIIEFGYTGDNLQCWMNLDFSREPFNDPYGEYCNSHVYVFLNDQVPNWIDKSSLSVNTDDGEDLYIIDRYETEDGVTGDTEPIIGFTFASDGVPFAGSVMVKRRHEAAIMDMLRSVTVVPDPGVAISVSNPPDVRALTDPNLHTRLYVPSFGLSFPLLPDFDKVMTYYGSEDFVCVTFDLTRPPFDEPADYVEPGQISYHPSEINIYLYRKMKPSYPGFGEFILFANDLGQYLVYADMSKTDSFIFFDFEAPGIPCGGTVSVRRSFFDTYEDDIRRMLCPREISDWEYGNMLNMSPPG